MGLTTILLIIIGLIAVLVGFVLAVKQINSPEKLESKYANSAEKTSVFVKKYKEADVAYYRTTILQMGLLVALGVMFLAFNY